MHPSILGVIIIECLMLGAQGAFYLERPFDRRRIWYIVFFALLLLLNISNCFFPNPFLQIPLLIQYLIRNGIVFITVSYLPYWLSCKIQIIKYQFQKKQEILLFFIVPYPMLFLVAYFLLHDLEKAHRYTIFIPAFNNLLLLILVGKVLCGIPKKEKKRKYVECLIAIGTIISWMFLYLAIHLNWGKAMETIFINLGPATINSLLLINWTKSGYREQRQLRDLLSIVPSTELITKSCDNLMLSEREKEIAVLLCQRLKRQQIADKLFISVRTVDKHIERIFLKAGVSSRDALYKRLNRIV